MFTGIDHVVIVVDELEAAIASYSRAGFTVVRGGKHPIGTHNALIAFADGSYFELIAFLKPNTGHPWQTALDKGGGIIDFCMRTDDLAADVESMRRAGAKIGDPSPLTRDRPDGYHLSWMLAIPEPPFNGQVPFLIKDDTPRDERVPRERSHRNGATGIRTLAIAVNDPGLTSRYYARALGRPGAPVNRADLEGAGVVFTIGPNELQLLASKTENGRLAQWIRARGQSPFEVVLAHAGTATALDPALLHGARIRFARSKGA
jgi:catechol 2,3-dioxygenase-like lactoylglutathione lyase family enzyme